MSGLKRLDKMLSHHQGITFEILMAVTDQIKLHSEGSRRIAKRQQQKLIIISNESIFENIL